MNDEKHKFNIKSLLEEDNILRQLDSISGVSTQLLVLLELLPGEQSAPALLAADVVSPGVL